MILYNNASKHSDMPKFSLYHKRIGISSLMLARVCQSVSRNQPLIDGKRATGLDNVSLQPGSDRARLRCFPYLFLFERKNAMTQNTMRKTTCLKNRIKRRHFLALLAGTVYAAPFLLTVNEALADYRSRPPRHSRPSPPSRPPRRSRPSPPSRPSRPSRPPRRSRPSPPSRPSLPSRPPRPPRSW